MHLEPGPQQGSRYGSRCAYADDDNAESCACPECSRCTCTDNQNGERILIINRRGMAGWLGVSQAAVRKAELERRIMRRPDGCYDFWDVVTDWIQNTHPKRLHPALR